MFRHKNELPVKFVYHRGTRTVVFLAAHLHVCVCVRACVCLSVCVCLCPFHCCSSSRHGYLVNFSGVYVYFGCVCVWPYNFVLFLLLVIGRPLFRLRACVHACVVCLLCMLRNHLSLRFCYLKGFIRARVCVRVRMPVQVRACPCPCECVRVSVCLCVYEMSSGMFPPSFLYHQRPKISVFANLWTTRDGRTDGWTDGWTLLQDAWTHLKTAIYTMSYSRVLTKNIQDDIKTIFSVNYSC